MYYIFETHRLVHRYVAFSMSVFISFFFFLVPGVVSRTKLLLRLVGIRTKYLMARLGPGRLPKVDHASHPGGEFKGKEIEKSVTSCSSCNLAVLAIF